MPLRSSAFQDLVILWQSLWLRGRHRWELFTFTANATPCIDITERKGRQFQSVIQIDARMTNENSPLHQNARKISELPDGRKITHKRAKARCHNSTTLLNENALGRWHSFGGKAMSIELLAWTWTSLTLMKRKATEHCLWFWAVSKECFGQWSTWRPQSFVLVRMTSIYHDSSQKKKNSPSSNRSYEEAANR